MGKQLTTVYELKINTAERKQERERKRQVKIVKIHCHLRFTLATKKTWLNLSSHEVHAFYNLVYLVLP